MHPSSIFPPLKQQNVTYFLSDQLQDKPVSQKSKIWHFNIRYLLKSNKEWSEPALKLFHG